MQASNDVNKNLNVTTLECWFGKLSRFIDTLHLLLFSVVPWMASTHYIMLELIPPQNNLLHNTPRLIQCHFYFPHNWLKLQQWSGWKLKHLYEGISVESLSFEVCHSWHLFIVAPPRHPLLPSLAARHAGQQDMAASRADCCPLRQSAVVLVTAAADERQSPTHAPHHRHCSLLCVCLSPAHVRST